MDTTIYGEFREAIEWAVAMVFLGVDIGMPDGLRMGTSGPIPELAPDSDAEKHGRGVAGDGDPIWLRSPMGATPLARRKVLACFLRSCYRPLCGLRLAVFACGYWKALRWPFSSTGQSARIGASRKLGSGNRATLIPARRNPDDHSDLY